MRPPQQTSRCASEPRRLQLGDHRLSRDGTAGRFALYFAGAINFVVPADFQPGKLSLTVQRGDGVQIRANADANILAPALFA